MMMSVPSPMYMAGYYPGRRVCICAAPDRHDCLALLAVLGRLLGAVLRT